MSSRIQVILQDASGNVNTTANVDLYDNAGTTKIGDFTNNGDGSYYYDLATSDKYRIKVDGTDQDEYTGRFWSTDDIKTHLDAAAPHSGHATDAELDAVKGTGWSTETVKGNADDITTIKGTGWTTEDIKTNADAITAMKGSGWTSAMTLVKLGDLNLAGAKFIGSAATATEALVTLAQQVWDNFRGRGSSGDQDRRFVVQAQYIRSTIGSDGTYILFWEILLPYDVILKEVFIRKIGTPTYGTDAELQIDKAGSFNGYDWDESNALLVHGIQAAGVYRDTDVDETIGADNYIGIALKTNASESQNLHGVITLHFERIAVES